ncbi:MAG: YfhO family protein [Chloroflexota bacterium]
MASTEAQRGRLRIVSGLELPARPSAEILRRGWRLLTHPLTLTVVGDASAVAVLLGSVVAVFWPLLTGIGVYAESDTFTYFFPVYSVLHDAVSRGELPLWTPDVFGGFPLFAEGQIGALYPPSLLAVSLLSTVDGFLLLRVFHVTVAVLGTFAFARALRVGTAGAIVGGLSFGLGSFVIAQQHHANLLATAVWLPVLLACLELSMARQGWLSHGLLGLAALLLGVAALATHVQPLMLIGATIGGYVVARQLWMAATTVRERGVRPGLLTGGLLLVDGAAIVVFVGAVGALIAAAQILPLYELSQESWRAHGWSYQDAIEYSLPPVNLLTLVFPFFFRMPDGGQWSLWQIWESVLYVGVAPAILAVVAAVAVRRWSVAFFTLTGLVSGLFALGGYAPYGLYEWLWLIPGMSLQRAPGRFTMVTALSLAMLAAHGADWVAARASDSARGSRGRRQLLALHVGVLLLLGALLFHLVVWRAWVLADRAWAMQVLAATYLGLFHDPLQHLEPIDVVTGLQASLDLANPKTAMPLAVMGLFALLVLVWRELPRARVVWQTALVALVAVDLVVFASDFHPLVDVSYLADPGPAGRMLVQQAGPWRVLTRPEVETPQPNELLPHGIAEAAGYSPLELERHRWYEQSTQTVDDVLLDLWSVRWIVETSRPEPRPSYHLVSFHPRRPLMVGGAGTPNGEIALQPDPTLATQIRLISGLSGGESIPDGVVVGEWLVTDADGLRYVFPVRAGREIAEWRPRTAGFSVAHRPIETAGTIVIDGQGTTRVLGYAELNFPRRVTVAKLEYRHLNPVGRTVLHGVALYDHDEDTVEQVGREDRYSVAYADPDVTIYENPRAYPRAFVVPEAVLAPDGTAAMVRLRDGPLDPRRQVVVESAPASGLGPFTGTPAAGATIVAEGTSVLDVQATAPSGGFLVLTDPFYPGWRAFVDGVETPILRADFLFRAVELPPGTHAVRFTFTPDSLQRGSLLSLAGLAIALLAIAVGLVGPLVTRVPWGRLRSSRRARASEPPGSAASDMVERESADPGADDHQQSVAPVQRRADDAQIE